MKRLRVELVRADPDHPNSGPLHAYVLQDDGRGGTKRGSNLITRSCSNVDTAKQRAAEVIRKAFQLIDMPEIDWILPGQTK